MSDLFRKFDIEFQATKGDPEAQYRYAVQIESEAIRRTSLPNYFENSHYAPEVVNWLRKAAIQGHPHAQNKLAHKLSSGVGVKKSESEAATWRLKAALSGHREAQYYIGVAYSEGHGVNVNFAEAFAWFALAASTPKGRSYWHKSAYEAYLKIKSEIGSYTLSHGQRRLEELLKITAPHID